MGDDWDRMTQLIEAVTDAPDLVTDSVAEIRASRPELSGVDTSDMARHTRALLAAATRALAGRRGPTEAELSFIEDLAVVRAGQGIPITAVLGAIHVSERQIWSAARAMVDDHGVSAQTLLDARDLYGDWSESVRQRLIDAHHRADTAARTGQDLVDQLLPRLLQGGSAATLAAAEAGLPARSLCVVVCPVPPGPVAVRLVLALRAQGAVAGLDQDSVVAVVGNLAPLTRPLSEEIAGASGPGDAKDLPTLHRLASAAAIIATHEDLRGITEVGDVAVRIALQGRPDLAAAVLAHHEAGLESLGQRADATVASVKTWLEFGRDTERTAERLFVHPNTVRNRVSALKDVTGLDATNPFEAVRLWWLCRAWQTRSTLP